MSAVMEQDPRRATRQDVEPPRHGALDMARRCRYLALLRRWAQERLPAGTRAAHDAADWARGVLIHAAMSDFEANASGSLLLRLRSRLLDGAEPMRAANDAQPSPRVEQLIGCDRLDVWESALAGLPQRQRELVILRIEFGLDYEAIAEEANLPAPLARTETVNALAALIDAIAFRQRARAA
ncbi:MAG TPA: sigma factor-like helix-turn-helix DNA-binding protein [Rhodanobacteraceae bacterium]|nr:sigma factor-like helix-turn-helix DNA-binding protein [Rhodanobacteraceae bacterium]